MRNSITDSASRTSQCAYRVRIVCERPRPPGRDCATARHGHRELHRRWRELDRRRQGAAAVERAAVRLARDVAAHEALHHVARPLGLVQLAHLDHHPAVLLDPRRRVAPPDLARALEREHRPVGHQRHELGRLDELAHEAQVVRIPGVIMLMGQPKFVAAEIELAAYKTLGIP